MVRKPCLKGVPGCGCAEKCGASTGEICCCSHTCAAICIKLIGGCVNECETGTGGGTAGCCTCEEPSFQYLEYDSATKSYHGEIGCGDVLIDVEFVVKYCPDSQTCVLCLLSDCLQEAEAVGTGTTIGTGTGEGLFEGSCSNLVSCQPVASGNISCIGVKDADDDLVGGIEHEWEVNVAGCGDPNCSAFTLVTKCIPRMFPKEKTAIAEGTGSGGVGTAAECGCTGCHCMCRDLCITYIGTVPCAAGGRVPYGAEEDENSPSDGWGLTVAGEGCDETELDRSISIVLQANETTGACELKVVSSYVVQEGDGLGSATGEILGTGTVSQLETIVSLASCPDVPLVKIWVDQANDHYFTFECWKCGACPEELICVCECDFDSPDGRGHDVSRQLTVEWSGYDSIGSGSGDFTITRFLESCVWYGTTRVECDLGYIQWSLELSQIPNNGTESCGWYIIASGGTTYNADGSPYQSGSDPLITCPDISRTYDFLTQIADWTQASPWQTSCVCDPLELTWLAYPDEDRGLSVVILE